MSVICVDIAPGGLSGSLAPHELKDLFIKTLSTDKSASSPGAGLGLIEMARRSKQQLRYQFREDDQGLQIFSFQVTIE